MIVFEDERHLHRPGEDGRGLISHRLQRPANGNMVLRAHRLGRRSEIRKFSGADPLAPSSNVIIERWGWVQSQDGKQWIPAAR